MACSVLLHRCNNEFINQPLLPDLNSSIDLQVTRNRKNMNPEQRESIEVLSDVSTDDDVRIIDLDDSSEDKGGSHENIAESEDNAWLPKEQQVQSTSVFHSQKPMTCEENFKSSNSSVQNQRQDYVSLTSDEKRSESQTLKKVSSKSRSKSSVSVFERMSQRSGDGNERNKSEVSELMFTEDYSFSYENLPTLKWPRPRQKNKQKDCKEHPSMSVVLETSDSDIPLDYILNIIDDHIENLTPTKSSKMSRKKKSVEKGVGNKAQQSSKLTKKNKNSSLKKKKITRKNDTKKNTVSYFDDFEIKSTNSSDESSESFSEESFKGPYHKFDNVKLSKSMSYVSETKIGSNLGTESSSSSVNENCSITGTSLKTPKDMHALKNKSQSFCSDTSKTKNFLDSERDYRECSSDDDTQEPCDFVYNKTLPVNTAVTNTDAVCDFDDDTQEPLFDGSFTGLNEKNKVRDPAEQNNLHVYGDKNKKTDECINRNGSSPVHIKTEPVDVDVGVYGFTQEDDIIYCCGSSDEEELHSLSQKTYKATTQSNSDSDDAVLYKYFDSRDDVRHKTVIDENVYNEDTQADLANSVRTEGYTGGNDSSMYSASTQCNEPCSGFNNSKIFDKVLSPSNRLYRLSDLKKRKQPTMDDVSNNNFDNTRCISPAGQIEAASSGGSKSHLTTDPYELSTRAEKKSFQVIKQQPRNKLSEKKLAVEDPYLCATQKDSYIPSKRKHEDTYDNDNYNSLTQVGQPSVLTPDHTFSKRPCLDPVPTATDKHNEFTEKNIFASDYDAETQLLITKDVSTGERDLYNACTQVSPDESSDDEIYNDMTLVYDETRHELKMSNFQDHLENDFYNASTQIDNSCCLSEVNTDIMRAEENEVKETKQNFHISRNEDVEMPSEEDEELYNAMTQFDQQAKSETESKEEKMNDSISENTIKVTRIGQIPTKMVLKKQKWHYESSDDTYTAETQCDEGQGSETNIKERKLNKILSDKNIKKNCNGEKIAKTTLDKNKCDDDDDPYSASTQPDQGLMSEAFSKIKDLKISSTQVTTTDIFDAETQVDKVSDGHNFPNQYIYTNHIPANNDKNSKLLDDKNMDVYDETTDIFDAETQVDKASDGHKFHNKCIYTNHIPANNDKNSKLLNKNMDVCDKATEVDTVVDQENINTNRVPLDSTELCVSLDKSQAHSSRKRKPSTDLETTLKELKQKHIQQRTLKVTEPQKLKSKKEIRESVKSTASFSPTSSVSDIVIVDDDQWLSKATGTKRRVKECVRVRKRKKSKTDDEVSLTQKFNDAKRQLKSREKVPAEKIPAPAVKHLRKSVDVQASCSDVKLPDAEEIMSKGLPLLSANVPVDKLYRHKNTLDANNMNNVESHTSVNNKQPERFASRTARMAHTMLDKGPVPVITEKSTDISVHDTTADIDFLFGDGDNTVNQSKDSSVVVSESSASHKKHELLSNCKSAEKDSVKKQKTNSSYPLTKANHDRKYDSKSSRKESEVKHRSSSSDKHKHSHSSVSEKKLVHVRSSSSSHTGKTSSFSSSVKNSSSVTSEVKHSSAKDSGQRCKDRSSSVSETDTAHCYGPSKSVASNRNETTNRKFEKESGKQELHTKESSAAKRTDKCDLSKQEKKSSLAPKSKSPTANKPVNDSIVDKSSRIAEQVKRSAAQKKHVTFDLVNNITSQSTLCSRQPESSMINKQNKNSNSGCVKSPTEDYINKMMKPRPPQLQICDPRTLARQRTIKQTPGDRGRLIDFQYFQLQILNWNPVWLIEQEKPELVDHPVPILNANDKVYPLLEEYTSIEEYQRIMTNLLLIETWAIISKEWKEKNCTLKTGQAFFSREECKESPELAVFSYTGLLTKEKFLRRHYPMDGDIIKMEVWVKWLVNCKIKSESSHKPYIQMGYIKQCYVKPIKDLKAFLKAHPKLRSDSTGEMYELNMKIGFRLKKYALQSEKPMTYTVLCSITSEKRKFLALASLPRSPLRSHILAPSDKDVFFHKVPTHVNLSQKSHFNSSQIKAIEAFTCSIKQPSDKPKICILQGPPGTGKTDTIIGLISRIVKETGGKVCLVTPSNAAADELMRRLINRNRTMQNGDNEHHLSLVRIGSKDSIQSDVKPYFLEEKISKCIKHEQRRLYQLMKPEGVRDHEKRLRDRIEECRKKRYKLLEQHRKTEAERCLQELCKLRKELALFEDQSEINPNQLPSLTMEKEIEISRNIIFKANVVCGTLNSFGSQKILKLFRERNKAHTSFQCIIIDEATQATELDCLIPLQYGTSKLVLVGDPEQLPPTVISQKAEKMKFGQSLFERFHSYFIHADENAVMFLDTQYRMDPEILHFPNQYVYQGLLRTDQSVIEMTQHFPLCPYLVFDMKLGQEECSQYSGSKNNPLEAEFTTDLCRTIKKANLTRYQIGILCPYQSQRKLIVNGLKKCGLDSIEVDTVDGFQGREKDIIIMSCVRARSTSGGIGFLADHRRMNVAMTRARYAFFIVAHLDSLQAGDNWKSMINDARKRNLIIEVTAIGDFPKATKQCFKSQRKYRY